MAKKVNGLVFPAGAAPSKAALAAASAFLKTFKPHELQNSVPLLLLHDIRSDAYYVTCHLDAESLAKKTDLEAVLDPQESEDYKLNRELYLDTQAYLLMEGDAHKGRSFEDIVVEFDTTYRNARPLKVFGGQHRVKAIREALGAKVDAIHGVRIYFGLSTEQRFDIATANNTSIAVSNDLLDRMQEELLGADLREWCQAVDLLEKDQNFGDRKNAEGIPTVRVARTLIVNYIMGKGKAAAIFHEPVVCKTGAGIDKRYESVRRTIDWGDEALGEMGKQFAGLHRTQRDRVLGRPKDSYLEFANKAIHPAVAAGWAYATGVLQASNRHLANHYSLPDSCAAPNDPLSARALLGARLKGVDPEHYRGLGARINSVELGRVVELFLLQATAAKRGIRLKLANAGIKTYHAKKAQREADKARRGL